MNPRHDELLRQILADPANDDARVVYADALQAAGDPRGEFIAIELGLAANPGLRGRRDELFVAHAGTWWPELPRHGVHTRGGFVDRIAATPSELDQASRLLGSEPVGSIDLVEPRATTRFAKAPWHKRIRRFAATGYFTDALRSVLASSLADGLVTLDVSGCGIMGVIPAIGGSLPRCTELVLADNRELGKSLPTLLDWSRIGALEILDISRCHVTGDVLAALLDLDLSSLRVLRLSRNPLEDADAERLVRALPRLPALRHVEMVGCRLEHAGIAALRSARLTVAAAELGDLPARVTLDLVSQAIELVRVAEGVWALEVDGVACPVRWQRGRSFGRQQEILVDWQVTPTAPLDPLAIALMTGASRILTDSSWGACVYPGARSGTIDSVSIDAGAVPSIRFWRHTELD